MSAPAGHDHQCQVLRCRTCKFCPSYCAALRLVMLTISVPPGLRPAGLAPIINRHEGWQRAAVAPTGGTDKCRRGRSGPLVQERCAYETRLSQVRPSISLKFLADLILAPLCTGEGEWRSRYQRARALIVAQATARALTGDPQLI
jgi:hypothetical protein